MAGYCITGSRTAAIPPASISTIASTHAKTGRSMKNCEITGPPSALRDACGRLAARARLPPVDLDRLHFRAGPHFLKPVEDHALARAQPGVDEPIVTDHASRGDHPLRDVVVVADDEHDRVTALV